MRERGRLFALKPRDATSKEGGRERVVWHLVTASRLETAETSLLISERRWVLLAVGDLGLLTLLGLCVRAKGCGWLPS